MKKQDFSKTTVKKCNPFLLTVLYGGVRAYCRLRGIRIRTVNKCGKKPEAPSIILCNHSSFIDFAYAAALCWKCRPHFIVARLYFYHRMLGGLLRALGSFPKSMFALDTESTKNCLRVLKNGEVLVMMPEARLSTVGRFEDIQESTFSFLKKSGVPVYTIRIGGDYFADPKWGKGVRRGAIVEAELDILFTAEEVGRLTVEEIRKGVLERLYYDEFEWIRSRPDQHYRCRTLAEGLENILTTCPICGEKYTITTKGHDLFCKNCGKLTSMSDRYGFDEGFRFENLADWYEWQRDLLKEEILRDENYVLSADVELRLPGNDGRSLTRGAGRGTCTLSRDGLRYCGTRDGEDYDVSFSLRQAYRLLFGAGENFEIYNGSEILYFVPDNRQSAVEWYMTSMILYDETAGK